MSEQKIIELVIFLGVAAFSGGKKDAIAWMVGNDAKALTKAVEDARMAAVSRSIQKASKFKKYGKNMV